MVIIVTGGAGGAGGEFTEGIVQYRHWGSIIGLHNEINQIEYAGIFLVILMILGTKARYAVMAMVTLSHHQNGNVVTLGDLARMEEIPLAYLEQIFTRLRKNGLVLSVRGPGGGYKLARPANEINIAEIIIATDESLKMTRCSGHSAQGCKASNTRCATHGLWEGLERRIYEYLESITLEDVCQRRIDSLIEKPATDLTSLSG